MKHVIIAAMAGVALAACSSEQATVLPQPIALTAEAAGHFCQMNILNHSGPKAQVHLDGIDFPLWFSQVRDALAYDRMPEEAAEITAIYVSDMGKATSWEKPGIENWIEISTASFVIGSSRRGGMGAPEMVPFSTAEAAQTFADTYGGTVLPFAGITDEMVLAPIEVEPLPPESDEVAHRPAEEEQPG